MRQSGQIEPAEPHARDAVFSSRKSVGEISLLLLTGLAFYLCWQLASPFLAAITWALALAVVTHPLHRRLEARLSPNMAAFLAVFAVLFIFIAPGIFLFQQGYDEARNAFSGLEQQISNARMQPQPWLEWLKARFDLAAEVKRAALLLAGQAPAALSGSVQFLTQFFLMLLILFYFLRDREQLLRYLGRLLPLSSPETGELFRRISETIYATLYGNLAVKLIQGALGGLMFWILGLPAPVPFGALMALFAMLPLIGTAFVWAPAALWLFLHGSWIKALVLVIWGALVISLIDNLLYPILVASEIKMHTLGILLSVFGGLIVFGMAGLVLGPVLLAITVALVQVWTRRLGSSGDIQLSK